MTEDSLIFHLLSLSSVQWTTFSCRCCMWPPGYFDTVSKHYNNTARSTLWIQRNAAKQTIQQPLKSGEKSFGFEKEVPFAARLSVTQQSKNIPVQHKTGLCTSDETHEQPQAYSMCTHIHTHTHLTVTGNTWWYPSTLCALTCTHIHTCTHAGSMLIHQRWHF